MGQLLEKQYWHWYLGTGLPDKKLFLLKLKSQNYIFTEHFLGTKSDYAIHNARHLKPQYTHVI